MPVLHSIGHMKAPEPIADRLDSWKAIGDYLGRDVRTLRRWEAHGLPVRRLAGAGRGSSVFAYKSEIDAWLKAGGATAEAPSSAPSDTESDAVPSSAPAPAEQPLPRYRPLAALFVIIIAAVATWWWFGRASRAQPHHVSVTADAVIASDASGREIWRHEFPVNDLTFPVGWSLPYIAVDGPEPGVLAATSYVERRPVGTHETGTAYWFSLAGQLLHRFSPEGHWTFGGGHAYGGPWALATADPIVTGVSRRIAVAAHDYQWWPSVVTILGDQWTPHSTFVNSGWLYGTLWVAPNRLVISGFNQEHDGGMVALLDPDAGDGASSDAPDGPFHCDNCGPARALTYVVLPRSELNRVTRSAFNWATVSRVGDRIAARTTEVDYAAPSSSTEAIYEFDMSLALISARYGDRYWERHRALELEGKITHSRDKCPERDGPPFVLVSTNGAPFTRSAVNR